MKKSVINYLICPACYNGLSILEHKKAKGRISEGELKCERCGKVYYIKNDIACFLSSFDEQLTKEKKRALRKTTLSQEIPKKWMNLYSKEELSSLKKEWGWMHSVIKKGKNEIYLDIATGTGRFLSSFVKKTKGEIIALEKDYPTCLELRYYLKKIKEYDRVSIICADARQIPLKDKTFDGITSWHGLDEPKMEKAIKESFRVLKNGSFFIASGVHYREGSKSFTIAKKEGISFITRKAIKQTLRKVGFNESEHKVFFQGKWNEEGSYLPVFNDFFETYVIKAKK